ncbi:transporter substrate-binding domain-containing protein [Chitinivorax sp. PXF-14]|uniref:substrate-binding periplasmic protein n=1 Tax=Chitinivorax sp. PXF-14 TaxID=3230488 RepID=UPI0034659B94
MLIGLLAGPAGWARSAMEIAVEDDAAPWSARDGTGFANDVVTAAYAAVDTPISLKVVPYSRCKALVVNAVVPACFSMSWSPELKGVVAFSQMPIFSVRSQFFQSTVRPIGVDHADQLPPGTVVGVVNGYEYPDAVYHLRDEGILRFEPANSEQINLKKLAMGRIQLALLTDNRIKPSEALIASAGVRGQVQYAFDAGDMPAYIGFSLLHPAGSEAKKLFDRGYSVIRANGTLKQIEKKWKMS